MLGDREFSPQAWAAASQIERGEMLASFLAKHPVDQLTATDVSNCSVRLPATPITMRTRPMCLGRQLSRASTEKATC